MTEQEKKSDLRDLHEIVEDLIKVLGSQAKLGEALGIYQSKVSQMKNARRGSDWQEHFRISAKLVELCRQHGIKITNPAPSLQPQNVALEMRSMGRKKKRTSGRL